MRKILASLDEIAGTLKSLKRVVHDVDRLIKLRTRNGLNVFIFTSQIGFNSGDPFTFHVHTRSSKDSTSQKQITDYENCPKLGAGVYAYKISGGDILESGCKPDGE